ncbi:MAG: hypothetical protein DCC50_03975 [Acidobacteria bacterium]|nr:MAG: hypothetical protein DCC50_03975 [Acidobacteriota bacterium]
MTEHHDDETPERELPAGAAPAAGPADGRTVGGEAHEDAVVEPDGTAGLEDAPVAEGAEGEDGEDGAEGAEGADPGAAVGGGPGGAPPPRRPGSPWWRLAVAAVAVGGLVWGASAADGFWRLDAGSTGGNDLDDARGLDDPGAFVEAALLACPGPEPLTAEGASPRVEVLAAGAPESVLDGIPPSRGDDGEATTPGPDDAASTQDPDAAAETAAPDDAAATAAPDEAAGTAAPDTAAATEEPDAAEGTGDAQDDVATDADSLLRLTGTDGSAAELRRGEPVGLPVRGPASALVEAQDGLAPGVVGGQLGLGTDQGARGLTLAGCTAPAEELWLVGGGDEPGRTEQLVLTNPGPDAVTVEVSVTGSDGPVAMTGGAGIVVPGRGRVVELLDAIAPGADAPVVRVTSSGGPVVAHLAEGYRDGTTDRGSEVVSAGAPPATDVVVPALPTSHDDRPHDVVLRLAAPGDSEAVVDLTALTAEGTVRLPDEVTRVPVGSSVDVALEDLPEGAVALRLRSDEPVVAGAWLDVLPSDDEPTVVDGGQGDGDGDAGADGSAAPSTGEEGGDEDGSTGQAEPLRRPAGETAWVSSAAPSTTPLGMALPGRGLVPDGTSELALTAVDGTTAWVTWVDEDGEEEASWVDLPNDTTELVPVPEDARAVWVVGAGPAGVVAALHVGGQDETGPYVTSATLPGLPWQRQLTEVRPVVP